MSLKLVWTNPNLVATRVRIYRKDTDFDSSSLPAPSVELTNGETSWIDESAVDGNTYYYVLGSKTDNDEVFTASQKILVADNRGIGPSVLKYGDASIGYFGEVLAADFVNSSVIMAAAASTSGLSVPVIQPTWYKFIRNNKIIYVPDQFFSTGAAFASLYNAGFVYGVDGPGPTGYPTVGLSGPVNQLRTFDFQGQRYKIRMMRGWSDGPITDVANYVTTNTGNHDTVPEAVPNEYNDFLYALCKFVPLKQRTENYNNQSPDKWLATPISTYDNGTYNSWLAQFRIGVQERAANGNVLTRGQRAITLNANQGSPSTKANLSAINYGAAAVANMWVPVLELVEQTVTL